MALHRCRVKLVSDHCDGHMLCVEIQRGLPPELRCPDGQEAGYGGTGPVPQCGCRVPEHLVALVDREVRENLEESRRMGFVRIKAA
jgi:hypothetical protein